MVFSEPLLFSENELFSTVDDAGNCDASKGDVPRTQPWFEEMVSD
jgi:hypothetical protein